MIAIAPFAKHQPRPAKARFRHRLLQALLCAGMAADGIYAHAQMLDPPTGNPPATPLSTSSPASSDIADARRLIAFGQFKDAESALRADLARDDRSADLHYLLAYSLLRQNQARQALEQYTRAAALRAPNPGELNDVAKAYVLLEDYSDAEKWLTRSLKMDPTVAETWYSMGRLRFTEQRFADALDCFKHALKLAPGNAKVENNLGLAYYGLNQTDEAEAAYRLAIRWQDAAPSGGANEQPLLNLGTLLVEQGQLTEAKELLTRAAGIAPQEPRIHEKLGQIFLQEGSYSDAQDEFQKAVHLDPDKSSLHYLLGQTLQHMGHTQDAKREFDTAARLSAQHSISGHR